jgi:hypothetical protein
MRSIPVVCALLVMASPALAHPSWRPSADGGAVPETRVQLLSPRLPIVLASSAWRAASAPFHRRSELPNSVALDRSTGWTSLGFDVNEPALGLFLEVRGEVEFDAADVSYADGSVASIPLGERVRPDGLYALIESRSERTVTHVRLTARARSSAARIGVRVGR